MPEPILSADAIDYYYDRCYEFVMDNIVWPARRVWKGFTPTFQQKELMDAISEDVRVAGESGHGSGKSSTLSWIAIWFTATRQNTLGRTVKVPVIAPTFHQLYDVIWPEFKRWIPLSRLDCLFTYNTTEVYRNGLKDMCWIRARSPKIAGHLQGNHAQHLLWLCDEAFGITDELAWETIEGSMTEPDNRIIVMGQHTTIVGFVHDAFNRDREFWHTLRFNSEESPIAKKAYIDRIAKKYGRESDVYRVRVLGMAPKGNPDAFISLEKAELARHRDVDPIGALEMGVDCARMGDDLTVVSLRKGGKFWPLVKNGKTDTDAIEKMVLDTLRKYRHATGDQSLCRIKVDATGGYGAGVIDALNKNTSDNIEVIPVYFTGRIKDPEYFDGTSKMWGELRDKIDYISLPDDDFLIEEIATRTFEIRDNRVKIQTKEQFKKDYESSPDRSDAVVLALTQKAGIQRVFPYYISTNADHRRNFNIPFTELVPADFQAYATLFADKDGGIYGSTFFWGRKSQKLYVYGELLEPDPVARVLAYRLSKIAVASLNAKSRIHIERVFGNDMMFRAGYDMQYLLRKEGVRVYQSLKYDEAGSVLLTNKMFHNNQIVVSSELEETDYQYRFWRKESGKAIDGFPLCRALCLIVSELTDRGEIYQEVDLPAYSKKKRAVEEHLKKAGYPKKVQNEKRIDDWLLK